MGKNKAAAAMGRLSAKKRAECGDTEAWARSGGLAAAAKMTPEERSERARKAGKASAGKPRRKPK